MPRIGDVVHYVSYGTPKGEFESTCRAAIVAAVNPALGPNDVDVIQLVVLNPSGLFFNAAEHDPGNSNRKYNGGTWHTRCLK